jgi:hypothetical protein
MNKPHHVSDHDQERYYFGMIHGPELAVIEEHLLWCRDCQRCLEQTERYLQAVSAAASADGYSSGQPRNPVGKRTLPYPLR